MHDGSNNANLSNIEYFCETYLAKSDEELMAISAGFPSQAQGIAAAKLLLVRRREFEGAQHNELMKAVETPHWSVAPSFWLLVISVVVSVLALGLAAYAVFGVPPQKQ